MDKIKNLLTQLTTGKNKKVFYIGLGIILVLIIFLTINKQSSLKNKNVINNDGTVGNDYIGIKEDDGTRFYSFNSEEIIYNDSDYGNINVTINAQLFFRETHERSYYSSHPYDKKEVSKQIVVYIENAIYKIISENENIRYNHLRDIITSERIKEIIKDQVASLGFEFVKVDIYTFALTKESMAIIREIEESKRNQFLTEEPVVDNNGGEETIEQPTENNENEEVIETTPEQIPEENPTQVE